MNRDQEREIESYFAFLSDARTRASAAVDRIMLTEDEPCEDTLDMVEETTNQ